MVATAHVIFICICILWLPRECRAPRSQVFENVQPRYAQPSCFMLMASFQIFVM
jgi:hypothetical protein